MNYLDIDNCILISDFERLKVGANIAPIQSKNELAKILRTRTKFKKTSQSAIYTTMYRAENRGYKKRPDDLIEAILEILNSGLDNVITEDHLIKEK